MNTESKARPNANGASGAGPARSGPAGRGSAGRGSAGRGPAGALRRLGARVPRRLRLPLGVGLLAQLGLLVWWLGYYPGLLAYDSIDYSWEVTTGHWVDNHSIAYDGCVWLTLRLTGDYALLTLTQTVAMACILGYLATGLRALRVPTGWIVGGTALTVALPTTGAFMVWVWKDVPYVIGSALACSALVHLVAEALRAERYDRRTGRRRDWLLLGAGLLTVCLARNNGFLAVLLVGVALVAVLYRLWRRVLVVVLVPVLLFFALDNGLYPALGVTRPTEYAGNTFVYADIGYAYSQYPASFSAADLALMRRVAPLAHWSAAGSDCSATDPLTNTEFNLGAAQRLNGQLVRLFLRVVRRTPQNVAEATICRGRLAWAVVPDSQTVNVPGTGWNSILYGFATIVPSIYQNRYYPIMRPHPPSSTLHAVVNWWYVLLTVQQLRWLLWGGAVWCWLLYGLLIVLAHRLRRREVLAIGAVTFGLQVCVFIAIPAPLFRYMAGPTMIGVMLLPLAFSRLGRDRRAR
jgi:hypothetical protein